MDMLSSVQASTQAMSGARLAMAVNTSIIKTATSMQKDALDTLLGAMGVGTNLNMEA